MPVLELPTKGGNLKQTCFERMYKKEPSLVNLNIIPSIELPTIQKPVCISRSFYKDREREECIYIKRTQFSKSKYNTLYRAESSQQCKNQFVEVGASTMRERERDKENGSSAYLYEHKHKEEIRKVCFFF